MEVLKKFSDCIVVPGKRRSAIYDLTRKTYFLIPNALAFLLENYEGFSREEILNNFTKNDQKIILEYFEFLNEEEIIFFTREGTTHYFPPIDEHWDAPSKITNALLETNFDNSYCLIDAIKKLETTGCQHFQIHILSSFEISFLNKLLKKLVLSSIKAIEIWVPFSEKDKDVFKELIKENARISKFIVYDSPSNLDLRTSNEMGSLYFTDLDVRKRGYSGVHQDDFIVDIKLYTEARNYHSYFNRKITIKSNGYITNGPFTTKEFGHISKVNLQEVISTEDFQALWFATKDKTEVCIDCEFRYMCIDQRLPIKKSQNLWFHNDECNYNPYLAKWKGEDGYMSLADFYNTKT